MAANNQIVKKSIQIDAGDTLRTVKSLKQEIADLRDELLNLEQGTEEYDEVQKQLHDDVEDLNEVMGAHKDKAEALEGSYNALQNELKELKQAWKETNDEAERDVLGQKINELNSKLSSMDQSIGDFHRNVGNYQSAWQGLTGVMENGEKITDDLEKGIKAFGTALGMSDKQVNALSKALKSLKDGFHIAKDIAKAREETGKLATEETKAAAGGNLLATSQKGVGAASKTMAAGELAAGGATKALSVAMRSLKAALISTGIGALIAALGTLIGLLDKAASKAKSARTAAKYGDLLEIEDQRVNDYQKELDKLERQEEIIDKNSRIKEAQGKTEKEILEYQIEQNKVLESQARLKASTAEADYKAAQAVYDAMTKSEQESETGEKQKEHVDNLKAAWEGLQNKVEDYAHEQIKLQDDIDVFLEKQKYGTKEVTNELVKWSDLIKNPQFQASWHALWQIDFSEAGSPIEVLKVQREAAKNLVEMYSGDTSQVIQFFDQAIGEAKDEWQSLVDKEKEIFDERLTPVQRLENEKAEWVAKAEKWGMDATNIVKYYDQKIQAELKRAEDERREKEEQAENERLEALRKQTDEQLQMMEDALSTQEKLHDIFNPMYMTDTASGDIEQEMNNLQTLYDTQMEYLNNLLASADLTEEAYQGVESRILSLTVAFNSQMNALKQEADYQGKNWAILSRKGVANFNLLESAAADFSSTFQSLGLENSVAYKGFATAQAIISSILAANRVLAEEPGGAIIKGIAAAATLAAGLANVAALWMVNPDGSNAGSAMNTQMAQPAVPVIGNSQPIQYSRNITTAEEEDRLNQPIYVKVTDIDEGLEGQRVRVENSSF
jgi:chromosome segregation ATPase